MRGAFTGGVLSAMAVHHPPENFDIVVAISSGACSAAYYASQSSDSRFRRLGAFAHFQMVWRRELGGSRLMSFRNILKGRPFLNQEYLVDEIFGERYRLNREGLDKPGCVPFYIGVSNLKTLRPEFIRATSGNILPLLKAATALPIATRGKGQVGEKLYTDGGVMEPLPIQTVIDAGYTDLTVILTNPRSYRSAAIGKLIGKLCYPKNRRMAGFLAGKHHVRYNNSYEMVNNPPPGVDMRIIDPDEQLPAGMIERDSDRLNRNVDLGLQAGYRFFHKVRRPGRFSRRFTRFFRLLIGRFALA